MRLIDILVDFCSVYALQVDNPVVLNADIDAVNVVLNGYAKTVRIVVITALVAANLCFDLLLLEQYCSSA